MSQNNHCCFCDSTDLFETFSFENITDRHGNIKGIDAEFTKCNKCGEEFVTAQQARNNDFKYFGEQK